MSPSLYEDPPTVHDIEEPEDTTTHALTDANHAEQPDNTGALMTEPEDRMDRYLAAGKLVGKVALITGGDSGIGRAVAIGLAKEGADVAIAYLREHEDARTTADVIKALGRRCEIFDGDLGHPEHAQAVVEQTVDRFGRLDIVISNAAEQHVQPSFLDVDNAQIEETFRTNVFAMMYLVRAALPHLQSGARIITTASVTAYKGNPVLVDYSATKGAIVSFTRALAAQLAPRNILVNAVAPGPIWTPLIPASMGPEQLANFGKDVPLGRPGQPDEVAGAYLFLASDDASYITGQTIHPNGGTPVGG